MTDSAAPDGLIIRPTGPDDREVVVDLLTRAWGGPDVVCRGRLMDGSTLQGFIALSGAEPLGLATYEFLEGECVLVTLNALTRLTGVGSALLGAVGENARRQGASRCWLVTSNDNLDAIRFYQRRGMTFAAVHPGAMTMARGLKPSIPLLGQHGIPIRDELEFEVRFN